MQNYVIECTKNDSLTVCHSLHAWYSPVFHFAQLSDIAPNS